MSDRPFPPPVFTVIPATGDPPGDPVEVLADLLVASWRRRQERERQGQAGDQAREPAAAGEEA